MGQVVNIIKMAFSLLLIIVDVEKSLNSSPSDKYKWAPIATLTDQFFKITNSIFTVLPGLTHLSLVHSPGPSVLLCVHYQ